MLNSDFKQSAPFFLSDLVASKDIRWMLNCTTNFNGWPSFEYWSRLGGDLWCFVRLRRINDSWWCPRDGHSSWLGRWIVKLLDHESLQIHFSGMVSGKLLGGSWVELSPTSDSNYFSLRISSFHSWFLCSNEFWSEDFWRTTGKRLWRFKKFLHFKLHLWQDKLDKSCLHSILWIIIWWPLLVSVLLTSWRLRDWDRFFCCFDLCCRMKTTWKEISVQSASWAIFAFWFYCVDTFHHNKDIWLPFVTVLMWTSESHVAHQYSASNFQPGWHNTLAKSSLVPFSLLCSILRR